VNVTATSQQDEASAARVVAALDAAAADGAAVLVASHDPALLARADATLTLGSGTTPVVAAGQAATTSSAWARSAG